jgi:hypothetical protein
MTFRRFSTDRSPEQRLEEALKSFPRSTKDPRRVRHPDLTDVERLTDIVLRLGEVVLDQSNNMNDITEAFKAEFQRIESKLDKLIMLNSSGGQSR